MIISTRRWCVVKGKVNQLCKGPVEKLHFSQIGMNGSPCEDIRFRTPLDLLSQNVTNSNDGPSTTDYRSKKQLAKRKVYMYDNR